MLAAQQTASDNVALIVVALVVRVLVILLVFVILSLISQGALAESVAAIDRGERRHFWSAWGLGSLTSGPCWGRSCCLS